MRINRPILLRIAEDTVTQRVRQEHGILSAYLCGSLLGEDFLLGGTTDIDLVFIHLDTYPLEREILRLSDEVHLDIAHYSQRELRQGRQLRLHPWWGPTIYTCQPLYDPQHFMHFTQASVRGQFENPENVIARARPQLGHARQIWAGLMSEPTKGSPPEQVALYLRAVEHAVNAVAGLSGPPLTERRFLLHFPQRAEAARRPGLYPGLLGILGAPHVDAEGLRAWLSDWQATMEAVPEAELPARLHPARRAYYQRAIMSYIEGEHPQAALWPLLRTWTAAANRLPERHSTLVAWEAACQQLGLIGSEAFRQRLAGLDAYLDMVDESLEAWAAENGV